MPKGIDTTRKAIDKLKSAEAELHNKIKLRKQQLRQAEKAQRELQALAIGRTVMDLLPEAFHNDEALIAGLCLLAENAAPYVLDDWRRIGKERLDKDRSR